MMLVDFGYVYLPYCLQKQESGNYAVLNRNYKPLGFNPMCGHIKYEDYPVCLPLKITPSIARKLSWEESKDTDTIYLYNDELTPTLNDKNMKLYLNRLAILSNINVE